jgi:hypothetical protein
VAMVDAITNGDALVAIDVGLACLWVQLQYSDGSKTNGVVSSEPLAASAEGRAVLQAYVATKNGKKVAKYVPF